MAMQKRDGDWVVGGVVIPSCPIVLPPDSPPRHWWEVR